MDFSANAGFYSQKEKPKWNWIEIVFCLVALAIGADRLLATRLYHLGGKMEFTLLGRFFLQVMKMSPLSAQYTFYMAKLLAFFGDTAICVLAGLLVHRLSGSRQKGILVYAVCMVLPGVGWISSAWAAADTICVAFILAGILALLHDKKAVAMICLGLACSLKIQYWIILPALLLLLKMKRIKWKHLFIIPATYLISLVPAVVSGLGSPAEGFNFLFRALLKKSPVSEGSLDIFQMMGFVEIWHKSGSYWVLASIVCGLGVCLVLAVYLMDDCLNMDVETWILSLTVFCMILLFFFPFLHERDYLLPAIMLVILAFLRKEAIGWAASSQILLWLSYCTKVAKVIIPMPALSVLQGLLIMFLIWKLVLRVKNKHSYHNYIQT